MKTLIVSLLFLLSFEAFGLKHQFHQDWTAHRTCTKDTRFLQNYCLELMELAKAPNQKPKHVLLLVSGLFQNTNAWDLIPEQNISMARYLRDKFNAHIFVLHTRGISNSDYVRQTNLDDLAIDDIPLAVKFILKNTLKRPIIIGHSQGSIVTQAFAAGLSRCGIEKNCFLKPVALARNAMVRGIGLIAGNPTLTTDRNDNFLIPLATLGRNKAIQHLIRKWDHIEIELLTRYTGVATFLGVWRNIYVLENVSQEARKAIWQKTVDSTTGEILIQFAYAVQNKDLTTRGGISYKSGLKNISAPLYQVAMEKDKLAPPISTKSAFDHIGSRNKRFEVVAGRGHLDFYMNAKFHSDMDSMMKFLIQH